ncbi:MAG TPA: hypothetical protein VEY95_05660 [Azospirillaceae bacterium]|nr:hypothetical protein [Azospirillaceae bacterium]
MSPNAETLIFILFALIGLGLCIAGLNLQNTYMISAAAVSAAFAASTWSVRSSLIQDREKISQFYLDRFIEGVEAAHDLLKDGNASRVNWISAARILSNCEDLSKNVTHAPHRDVIKMKTEEYRHKFGRIIAGPHITPSFFFGVDPGLPLDEAAKEASKNQIRTRSADSIWPPPESKELPPEAIYQIWRFAKFPKNYDDPLENRFSEDEKRSLRISYPALHDWINFRDNNKYYAGKRYQMERNQKTSSPPEMNEQNEERRRKC